MRVTPVASLSLFTQSFVRTDLVRFHVCARVLLCHDPWGLAHVRQSTGIC